MSASGTCAITELYFRCVYLSYACLLSRLPCAYVVTGGQNKQHSAGAQNAAKLDRETEELHHDTVGLDVGRLIQQGRQNKEMTQKELATVGSKMMFWSHNYLRM